MSLYDAIADLQLTVHDHSLTRPEQATPSDFHRVTTTTTALHRPTHTGRGEDVTYDTPDHDTFHAHHDLDLTGTYTIDDFSTHLGDPPTTDRVHAITDRVQDIGFKLDPTTDWTPILAHELADTTPIRILDLKGHYEDTTVDADADLYELVLDTLPDTLPKPPLTPPTDTTGLS
jgi:hypothetical protein